MKTDELKFLLKLLGCPDYRAAISEIKPNSKTPAPKRDRICRDLGDDREWVACTEEVTKIKIVPPGKALLKLDSASLPITSQELKILQACEKGTIPSSQTRVTPAKTRQEIIEKLIERGLIEAAETKLKEVWLTERGKEYLAKEYDPRGAGNISLTKNMLADYLQFLRTHLSSYQTSFETKASTHKPSDKEVLQAIINLDRGLGTDNYLPIFHLRQKLQPPLSREELDRKLYSLQRNDKIELSALQEAIAYTPEQIDAGIPQDIGGRLFFIIVN